MSVNKNILILMLAYILIVFLFAFVYYIFWQDNPDNFIVQEEINLFPIADLRQLLQLDNPSVPLGETTDLEFSLSEVSTITEEHKRKLVNTYTEMKRLQSLSDTQWKQIIDLVKQSTDIADKNFDKYFDSQTSGLRLREQEFLDSIASLEQANEIEVNADKRLQNQLEISSLGVELSRLRIEKSEKELALYQEYFNNSSKFQDPEIINLIDDQYKVYDETQVELKKTTDTYYDLRGEVYQTWLNIRDFRVQRLSYSDFLYFSFTISIASPFGDILPNNRIIRILVFFQLFLDIFLVGVFVSRFTETFTGKQVKNINPNNHRRVRKITNFSSPRKRLGLQNKRS